MPERMELDQIDVIDAQPVERAVDVLPTSRVRSASAWLAWASAAAPKSVTVLW
jgi:hypothetical protein